VIHAAGVPGRGIIQLKTSIDIDRVFAPKIGGAMVLADVFDSTELDFLVLFSSLSPIFGGPGQVDYSAANAFLDVFAQEAAMKGARVLSINWDRWAEVGMAVNELTQKQGNTRRDEGHAGWLAHGIRTREGMEAFTSALGIPTPQIAVSPQDLGLLTRHGPPKPISMGAEPVIPVGDRHPRPDVIGDYVAPSNDIEEKIAQQFESLLGIERVGIHDNFFELGGHSLSGTQLTARLRDVLDIEIPIDLLFNAPTVHALADVISSMQQDYQRSDARGDEIANIPSRISREDGSVVGV
jgi:acyl carrier protein